MFCFCREAAPANLDMARLVETQRQESLRAAEARASSFLSSFSKGELSTIPIIKSLALFLKYKYSQLSSFSYVNHMASSFKNKETTKLGTKFDWLGSFKGKLESKQFNVSASRVIGITNENHKTFWLSLEDIPHLVR